MTKDKNNTKKIAFVVPVYNEEKILTDSIEKLYHYFERNIPYDWIIAIANNASTDSTKVIAEELCKKYPRLRLVHLDLKGRGRALKQAWTCFDCDAVGYCDVDLATDISHVKELFDSVLENGYDISTGNRYLEGSNSNRTKDRLFYSKIYIYMVKSLFNTKLSDFQCGFKAINKKAFDKLVRSIDNNEWFFDTELLLRAEHNGLKIRQIPVKWNEMRVKDSRVNILDTGYKYTKQITGLKLKLRKK